MNSTNRNGQSKELYGFQCLPGEFVLQRAPLVKRQDAGGRMLKGPLFCTTFRIVFVPERDQKSKADSSDPVFLRDQDIVLASIERVVAGNALKTKIITPSSHLKFVPEELIIYCKDLRIIHFQFERMTSDLQAIEITLTIARTYQPVKPGAPYAFQKSIFGNSEMKQLLSNRVPDSLMNWFEGSQEWERELLRTGATGWRVSSVNDRFEMAPSLQKFNVVPKQILDNDLKKTFAHFSDGRIPRWCWHHPGGSDLLRMATFQNNMYHEKDDIRHLEALLFGCHPQCVIVDLGDELPTPVDIQAAHSRLRTLCLGDIPASVSPSDEKWLSALEMTKWLDHVRSCLKKSIEVCCLLSDGHLTVILQESDDRDLSCAVSSLVQLMCDPHSRTLSGFQSLVQKEWAVAGHRFLNRFNYSGDNEKEESPVFLLFLDCVWQLLKQFPSFFEITEDYLLAVHDSTYIPIFNTFLANCQRERARRIQHTSQSYTPVNGWYDVVNRQIVLSSAGCPLPSVWDWALQCSPKRRAQFCHPGYTSNQWINRCSDLPSFHKSDASSSSLGPVMMFAKGSLTTPSQILPWRSTTSYRWGHRKTSSIESLPGLDWVLKSYKKSENSKNIQGLEQNSPVPYQCESFQPLVPLLCGPYICLWRSCYLRGSQEIQCFLHTSSHPCLELLASEVDELRCKLKEALKQQLTSTCAVENCNNSNNSENSGVEGINEKIMKERRICTDNANDHQIISGTFDLQHVKTPVHQENNAQLFSSER
ncbi:myotubularin-related protein 11 isoform X2 [Polypterus senegalus]|nr:myotubularin-related protein 11 isoform X2 [Polypterus senegalus]